MAVLKLSQIAASASGFVTGDFLVAVQGGTTDVLFSKAQLFNPPVVITDAANPSTSTLTLTGATALTTSHPVLSMTQTWNNAAVVFTGAVLNITNTASAAGSLLLDLQVAGTSKFNVQADGEINFNLPNSFNPVMFFSSTVRMASASNYLAFGNVNNSNFTSGAQTLQFFWDSNGAQLYLDVLRFGGTTGEPNILRDATGILAQVNGTNAQTFRVYNTFTNSSNYERGGFDWQTTANTLRVRSENAGTGTNRIIAIDGFDKAGAAANTDLPSGTWALIHDTNGATFKLVYNASGTLKTVALV